MTGGETGNETRAARIAEATDWFALMRSPDASAAQAAFDAWRADPDNARAYAEIEQVWAVTGAGRSRVTPQRQSAMPSQAWPRYAIAATLMIIAIGIAFLLAGYSALPVGSGAGPAAYASRIGEIRTITLSDGSTVTLDTASRLRVDYSRDERRVTRLGGRARFAVAHNPGRPFIVLAAGKAVVARGTVFDVRLNGAAIEVTLLEGAVDIEHRRADASPVRIVRLVPGEQVRLEDAAASAVVESVDHGTAQWTSGLIEVRGMPLAGVIAEANRYSRDKIVLAEPALGHLRVSGALRPGDAEALAARLAATFGLAVSRRADGAVLLARKPD